jgi:hypothetical protein
VALLLAVPASASGVVRTAGRFSYVSLSAHVDADKQGELPVKCPKGTFPVGGGAYTSGSTLEDEVASNAPYDGKDQDRRPDDGWIAEVNAGPNISGVTMVTYAVCAPFDHLAYVAKESVAKPQRRHGVLARCPAPTTLTLGGGVMTTGRSTQVALGDTEPEHVSDDRFGWTGAVNNGRSKEERFTVWAVCRKMSVKGTTGDSQRAQDVPTGQHSYDMPCYEPGGDRHVLSGGTGLPDIGLQGEVASTLPFDDASDVDSTPDNGWTSWLNNESLTPATRDTSSFCMK